MSKRGRGRHRQLGGGGTRKKGGIGKVNPRFVWMPARKGKRGGDCVVDSLMENVGPTATLWVKGVRVGGLLVRLSIQETIGGAKKRSGTTFSTN